MNNIEDLQESSLLVLGGFISEVDAPSLPAGSAAVCCDCDFTVSSVRTRYGIQNVYTYDGPARTQFNYVKTFEMTDGQTLTLALDSNGVFWQEDIDNTPGVLTPFFSDIEPNTFALSVTDENREFIALSDLSNGTDMPRQYNGQWVDRLSQLGPGAAPSIAFNSAGYPIISVSQPAPVAFGPINAILWSAGPEQRTVGNIVTFYAALGNTWGDIQVGSTIVLAGFTGVLAPLDNDVGNPYYTVTSMGTAIGSGGNTYNIFTIVAPESANHDIFTAGAATYQLQLATVTTSVPVPNTFPGQQISISGVTPSTWDGTWTVINTPNAAQLAINTTVLSGNVASYSFTLLSGSLPAVGEQVTVTGTTNGNGIFNVLNATISSVGGSTFSLVITSPDIPSAPEAGNGIINGTQFQFDPLMLIAPGTGGEIVSAGTLGAGTRGAVVMFLTRNGYITAPSPQIIFTIGEGASSVIVSNLPIGPPNVIARIIAFTGAGGATQTGGGGFYYWIEEPVKVIDNGQIVTYDSTIVNDNTTTQVTLSFTDAVLLAATGISIDGNNLFAQIELGSCIGLISYADRLAAWGEQNKIQNLLNFSFDGGIGQIPPPPGTTGTTQTYPLGWTIDPVNGMGGSVTVSPLFGNAYYIQNTTGSTQALYGMITQPAFKDSFGVPIIVSATDYSIRVTADCPSQIGSGDLVIDLYSPSLTQVYGSFSIPLLSMAASMEIFTGTLLTLPFSLVPPDLLIRIYATNLPNGGDVAIDRIEPYPTDNPVLTTQMRLSYANNLEAFDDNTGDLGASQNQQPIRNAFVLFDNLYIVKTKSLFSTSDNGTTQPNFWNVRQVSNKVGTPSIYGVDVGEGWALVCGEAGLYVFTGGDPVKITPELDGDPGLWQTIDWTIGQKMWIRNDTEQRKIYIGVPIPTPNKWMPHFPVNASPIQPNVVLMCNYKEIMTGGALQSEGPIRLTYTGELKTYSFGRKWSAWSIEACYADFITRADTSTPLFFCEDDGTGQIYQQITNLYSDNGEAMHCEYITAGLPKTSDAEQKQMGLGELEAMYMTLTIKGDGQFRMTIIPDDIDSPYAEALYPEPLLNPPPYGDMEIPINQVGNRFFMDFSVRDAGEWFDLSRVVMWIQQSPWGPVRGSNG